MYVVYSALIDSLALVGAFKKDRRRQKGAFSVFCVVQGLGVQCALCRSGYWYSAHCTGVLAPGSMTGVVMFPQSRHSRPTTRTSQCPRPGKIFDHGEKYLVHTVRPGSSDLIITETVDCVHSLHGAPH